VKKKNPTTATSACSDEVEEVRTLLHSRADLIRRQLKIPMAIADSHGGPVGTLDLITKILYASHYKRIFKDYDPRDAAELLDHGLKPHIVSAQNTTTPVNSAVPSTKNSDL